MFRDGFADQKVFYPSRPIPFESLGVLQHPFKSSQVELLLPQITGRITYGVPTYIPRNQDDPTGLAPLLVVKCVFALVAGRAGLSSHP